MTEYQKDLQYVTMRLKDSLIIEQINAAKGILRHFEDKWSTRLSITDPTFKKDRQKLNALYQEKYSFISKSYLLNWFLFLIFVGNKKNFNMGQKHLGVEMLSEQELQALNDYLYTIENN